MKNLLLATATAATLQLSLANDADAALVKRVDFDSNNQNLVGNLYLPDDYQQGDKLPGVVVTGAWTTVKEQMPATYAEALADRGYAVQSLSAQSVARRDLAASQPALLTFVIGENQTETSVSWKIRQIRLRISLLLPII